VRPVCERGKDAAVRFIRLGNALKNITGIGPRCWSGGGGGAGEVNELNKKKGPITAKEDTLFAEWAEKPIVTAIEIIRSDIKKLRQSQRQVEERGRSDD